MATLCPSKLHFRRLARLSGMASPPPRKSNNALRLFVSAVPKIETATPKNNIKAFFGCFLIADNTEVKNGFCGQHFGLLWPKRNTTNRCLTVQAMTHKASQLDPLASCVGAWPTRPARPKGSETIPRLALRKSRMFQGRREVLQKWCGQAAVGNPTAPEMIIRRTENLRPPGRTA